jgi:hypothetical protein
MKTIQLAQLKVPDPWKDGQQVEIAAPSGTSPIIQKGGETAGKALAQTAFDWIFYIAVILAVLYIMWSGIQWMTSGGDATKLASAKRRMIYAIIGLVVVLMSFLIVRIVLTVIGADGVKFMSPFSGL